jgi:hypothetical protein
MDNLNTHASLSPYKSCVMEDARRLARRLEIHYAPRHGSWLDMPEIESGVPKSQRLDRRIGDMGALGRGEQALARLWRQSHCFHGLAVHDRRRQGQIKASLSDIIRKNKVLDHHRLFGRVRNNHEALPLDASF